MPSARQLSADLYKIATCAEAAHLAGMQHEAFDALVALNLIGKEGTRAAVQQHGGLAIPLNLGVFGQSQGKSIVLNN
jgi:hypothetical protein